MSAALEVAGLVLLGGGLALATIGLVGMLRHRDIFHQLHLAGLVQSPAVILVLAAAIGTRDAEIVTSAALIILFVLVTSPLSGHAIARAAWRRRQAGARREAGRER